MLENNATLRLHQCQDPDITDPLVTFDHLILATGSVPATLPVVQRRHRGFSIPRRPWICPRSRVTAGDRRRLHRTRAGNGLRPAGLAGERRGTDRRSAARRGSRSGQAAAAPAGDRCWATGSISAPQVTAVSDVGDAVDVTFAGAGASGTQRYSHVLVAVGRKPTTERLGLEHTQRATRRTRIRGDGCAAPDGRAHDPGHRRRGGRTDARPQGHASGQGGCGHRLGTVGVREPHDPGGGLHRSRDRLGRT